MFALVFLISHLIADYCLQHRLLAMNKFKMTSEGWRDCFFHCIFYSVIFSVGIVLYDWLYLNMEVFSLVTFSSFFWMIFLTHFPIDKFSLGKYVMKAMGRQIENVSIDEKIVSWIVYVVIDNTMHFVLMLLGIHFFFPRLVQ